MLLFLRSALLSPEIYPKLIGVLLERGLGRDWFYGKCSGDLAHRHQADTGVAGWCAGDVGQRHLVQFGQIALQRRLENLWYTSYSDWQRFQTVLTVGLNAILAGLILQRGYGLLANKAANPKVGAWIYTICILFAGYAAYKTFGLAINGRYISFPTVAVYIPVVGMFGLMIISYISERPWSLKAVEINRLTGHLKAKTDQDRIIGYALPIMGLMLVIWETKAFMVSRDFILAYPNIAKRIGVAFMFSVTNCQLVAWLMCLAILALPLLVSGNKK